MWSAAAFYLTIACIWLMTSLALRRAPWGAGAMAQAAYRRSMVAYCCWCTIFLPPVYRALDRVLGIPNGTRLVLAVTAILGAYTTQPWLDWFVPPGAEPGDGRAGARRRMPLAFLDSRILLVAILGGTVGSFFLVGRPDGVVSAPLNGSFLSAYGRDPWLLLFLLLAHGYVAGVYSRLIVTHLPTSRLSLHRLPDPVARYRVRCCLYATLLGLCYNLHELARALFYNAGFPAHTASHNATASLVLACYNVGVMWSFYGSFRWLAHYRAYRQLGLLWWPLYRVIPTIAHRVPRSHRTDGFWLGPRAVGKRLRSRIYEIWDGISTLYPYRSAALAQQARAACAVAGLPDEEAVPIVEAVLLRASIAAKARNSPPAASRLPLPALSQQSLGEQIAFLQRVAWAWTHSPIVGAVLGDGGGAGDIAARGQPPDHRGSIPD